MYAFMAARVPTTVGHDCWLATPSGSLLGALPCSHPRPAPPPPSPSRQVASVNDMNRGNDWFLLGARAAARRGWGAVPAPGPRSCCACVGCAQNAVATAHSLPRPLCRALHPPSSRSQRLCVLHGRAGPRGRAVPRPGGVDPPLHPVHRLQRLLLLRPHHRAGAARGVPPFGGLWGGVCGLLPRCHAAMQASTLSPPALCSYPTHTLHSTPRRSGTCSPRPSPRRPPGPSQARQGPRPRPAPPAPAPAPPAAPSPALLRRGRAAPGPPLRSSLQRWWRRGR